MKKAKINILNINGNILRNKIFYFSLNILKLINKFQTLIRNLKD